MFVIGEVDAFSATIRGLESTHASFSQAVVITTLLEVGHWGWTLNSLKNVT